MNCPRCSRELQPVVTSGVTVDVCQNGCGGIWFDAFELEKMDQPDESANGLLDDLRVDLELTIDREAPVTCPRCKGTHVLMRQQYPGNHQIQIDKCQACGGTWLDFGELFEIRSSNPTTEERRKEAIALLRGLHKG